MSLAWEAPKTFVLGSLAVIFLSSLLSGWLLSNHCPEAAGSGIPQLKLAFWKDFGYVPLRTVAVKFVAGVLSVGGGASLGREGPSVHIAGGLASATAGTLGEAKQQRREAAAAGAAAGLAAAFNTPIAAVTFVLEELIQDLNSRYLGGVLLASMIGAFTVYATLGEHPAFELNQVNNVSWLVYLVVPLVAALASFIGVYFQRASLGIRRWSRTNTWLPRWAMPGIGALITWGIGVSIFLTTAKMGIFGLGYADLSAALNGDLAWKTAALLLLGKLIATSFCYGLGSCGGIFAPCLFFGGMTGLAATGLIDSIGPAIGLDLSADDKRVITIVGMSACLGAVVRAPVTSILIVFEMTHQFAIVPALMLGALISQAISHAIAKKNFYETVLEQDGHDLEHVIPPRDLHTWQQLPVSAIASFNPISAESLDENHVRDLLENRPYYRFPVRGEGENEIQGILVRPEALEAFEENRPPALEPVTWCSPRTTIRELQMLLIDSTSGVALIHDSPRGKLLGLVTLHDLLRAQVNYAKENP